ncbi:hypothetical protein LAZ67_3004068 [Cordylochernes scorpioides]|uniref:RNA-directed DNA polymerase n=1 Tax=Cordylochernes scorpioides TaxID=51811 RepID=A0ABY6K9W4_9ARAC|nr:hypothetical protein LAZ67_3004068 [Cordylochernes scorpioides]
MDEKNETQDAEEYTAEGENNPAVSSPKIEPPPPSAELPAVLARLAACLSALQTTSDRVTHRTEIEVQSFDGTYPAAQFFRTYDQKTDWDGLTNTEKVLRLPRYLNNKPLEHFRRLRMETQHYIQVRQTFLDLYPETNEATYAQYFSMKLAGQPNLEEYYRNKTALGLQLGLPQEVILETLTEGLPPSDQRLVRIVPPENLGAWFRLVQRIRGSGAPSPRHPDEHAPPLLGPYAPVRPSPRTVPTRSTPPTDCRFCGGLHWHSECRLRQAPQLPRASGDARAARSAQLAEQRPRAQPHHQASRAQATGITKGAPDQQPAGAVNVYNKFIPDYARLRTPLNNLLKKDVTWDWDDKCQKAFTSLKESLTQHPVLHLYKDELPCQVYCDASTLGIAGVLKQVHSAGKAYPVQYFSRALRVHERNYTISELECLAIVESVEKFRVYLMGRKFTIFSDHHALQWLKTIKNPSGRLFRWSLRLSCYEYEVRYIKGSLQHEADLLSRNPFCGFLDTTLIKNHQLTPSGESKLTIDRNGLQTLKRRGVTKIVVPDALVPDLLTKVHSRYNHPGISQMTRLISPQYYWKGMSEDISKTTKACAICQSTKHPRGPTFGELGQLPVATQPFDLVALDTIAGLAKYGNAKAYLHVVVDHFSRYTWTFPSKSTSITTYQQVIKRVLQDGSPKRLLTDRAPAFTSPKFRKFLINRNIHPLLTTSNNPQANGICERLNATLTGKLRLLHLENPKAAWTKLAKRVTVVYNNTPHSVTGFPPGYLMFGVLPPELTEHVNPYPVLTTARRIAHERTQAKHLKDKHAYDQQHKTPHFEPGDLVLVKVYHHPNTGKLAPYFTGPYEILEIISPNVERNALYKVDTRTGEKISPKERIEENSSKEFSMEFQRDADPPAREMHASLAAARDDVTPSLAASLSHNSAARAPGNWADCAEDLRPGADDGFTVVKSRKRRRESAGSPTAAEPSSNAGGSRTIRRPQSSAGSVPRAQEIRATRAHIAEARARQASSSEDHCVYLEHGPELEPFHYLRALDRMLGGTAGVIQVSKVNGHQLLGLANRGLAERLINEGLEVEGTLLRAFPFRKRAERITVGNLPFFVEDSAIISALKPYGRVTSIAPKLMKAGPYTYNDGRREAFIVLREGTTTERLPTRLEIPIKGEAWPAYLSSGIKCSRCHGQGHRRANCPLLAGRTNAPRPATPTSPTSVPPVTAPGLPQQPSAHPPPPASPSPAMETPSASPAARAVTPSAAPRPSTPVAPAVPVEMAPPAPPPVTPAPSLRAPGGSVSPQSTKSGPPAQDIEMPAIEESSASSTSSSRTSMRDDLVAFIRRSPTVSFTGTDALGLGREEVLDLLSSRTKAQRKRWLLTPPQTDALAGLIKQILGLKPAGNTNVYKILHQVKSELKKGPAAVPPTPPLPAPWPAEPAPPAPKERESTPAMATRCDELQLLTIQLMKELNLWPQLDSLYPDLVEAVLYPEDRKGFLRRLSPGNKKAIIQVLDKLSEHTRDLHSLTLRDLSELRAALPSDLLLK